MSAHEEVERLLWYNTSLKNRRLAKELADEIGALESRIKKLETKQELSALRSRITELEAVYKLAVDECNKATDERNKAQHYLHECRRERDERSERIAEFEDNDTKLHMQFGQYIIANSELALLNATLQERIAELEALTTWQPIDGTKSETMWAIYGKFGFYSGTAFSRKDMIKEHTFLTGKTWEECQKKGDKVVKVIVMIPKPPEEK
ncbi:MAG TPA: hypothetical protein DCR43_02885 [Bacteroidales bacterium]|nr:hypothetical protein [Bacteroidales bacterium]